MLRLAKLTDYGTVIATEFARHPERIYSAASLARQLNINEPTVGKLLKQLARGGILRAYRGKHGGYRLNGRAEDISLAQLLELLEGGIGITECSSGRGICQRETDCAVREHWLRINQAIYDGLSGVSLADMARPLREEQRGEQQRGFLREPLRRVGL